MPEPVLPTALVLAIGRVTVNGTMLESDVTMTLWSILGWSGPVEFTPLGLRKEFKPPSADFSTNVKDLRAAASQRLEGELQRNVLTWLDNAKNIQGQRHDIVHGVWSARPNAKAKHLVRGLKRTQAKWMSVADVNTIADRLYAHRAALISLMPGLLTALPQMEDTTLDVPRERLRELDSRQDAIGGAGPVTYPLSSLLESLEPDVQNRQHAAAISRELAQWFDDRKPGSRA